MSENNHREEHYRGDWQALSLFHIQGSSSCPSFSVLKLTEVVAMLGNDDGDGVHSEVQSQPEDTVYRYEVKPEFMRILRKITVKHEDISKNCVARSAKDRSKLLEIIREILHDFRDMDLRKVKESFVENKISLVKGLHEGTKLELEWLSMILAEVLGAIKILDKFDILEEKRDNNSKLLEDAESELEVFQEEKKVVIEKMKELLEKMRELSENMEEICVRETACKERLTTIKKESTSISQTYRYCTSKVSRFLKRSVMDGLI
ncbi:plant phospholipase-like protein [Medicago truncatula]|uniref:Plant phospholipase-like protein n=1 Tax=Medicago truncatula TaxID=3880 RepID=A0A072UHN0_MEDTR|nr:plant phospholipase-like protein [Medicago truncatula]